ncbi:hypothetical protein BGX27_000959 [Mortierella sp. AM989]|nr:hypothetical protein BGX27_000959 [Mortierella sp. AM989]
MSQPCDGIPQPNDGKLTLTNTNKIIYDTKQSDPGRCVIHGKGPGVNCTTTVKLDCKFVVIQKVATPTPITTITTATGGDVPVSSIVSGSNTQVVPVSTATLGPGLGPEPEPIPFFPSVAAPTPSSGNASSSPQSSDLPLPAIIGGSVGGVVLILLVLAFILVRRRRRMRRSKDTYLVQVKSEPDLGDEKLAYRKDNGSEDREQRNAQPSNGSRDSNNTLNNAAHRSNSNSEKPPRPLSQYQQYQQYQRQQQQNRGMTPQRNESRMSNHSSIANSQTQLRPGTPSSPMVSQNQHNGSPIVAKIDYTPRSTYIPSTPATQKPSSKTRTSPPPSLPLKRQDTQVHDGSTEAYIDLIPVEDTPRVAHATLQDPAANDAYSRMREEQVARSKSMGRNVGSGGGAGGSSNNYSKALVDEDEEVNEDDIMYL